MPYSHYDRLSAMDSAFLDLEDGNVHMHIGSIGIFDAEPLQNEDGGMDFDRVIELVAAAVRKNVRFQQRISYVPALKQPVWVDDEKFNLRYHVRHTSLPAPGSERLLKRLTGRIMSEELDRGKALWEMWFVEGVEGNRFAIISKIHHSVVDGISAVDLLSAIVDRDPGGRPKPPGAWIPRPAPSGVRLLADDLMRRAEVPLSLVRGGVSALSSPGKTIGAVRDAALGLGQAAKAGLVPASETPFNEPLGPHRRCDWTRFELEDLKQVRKRSGGALNDVVLAIVSGAIRRFFINRGFRVEGLDFRALVPVNLRGAEVGTFSSRVSTLLAPLPLDEADPLLRLRKVVEAMRELKQSKQRKGGDLVAEVADWTFTGLMLAFARFGLNNRAANMVVTNVPGPRRTVHLLGARMREVYPMVPLGPNQTLGVALFSYDGGLYWGFNSDWDVLPDLHDFIEAVEQEFEEICEAAGEASTSPKAAEAKGGEAASAAGSARSAS